MEKISRKGFLKVAAAAAMSGVTAGALAACNSAASSSTAASGDAIYTAGTYTGHENVDLSVGVVPNLLTGGLVMLLRVGGVLKLFENDTAGDGGAQTLGLSNGAFHTGCTGSEHYFCAISLHQVAAFYAHRLRHGENELITFHG